MRRALTSSGGWVWVWVHEAEDYKRQHADALVSRGGLRAAGRPPPATRSELFTPFQPSIDFP